MGNRIPRLLVLLAFLAILVVFFEFGHGTRNDALPPEVQIIYIVAVIGALVLSYLLDWSTRKSGDKEDGRDVVSQTDNGRKAKAGYLTDYNSRQDWLETYSMERLVLIGLVIGYGIIESLMPDDYFADLKKYAGFGLLIISALYWVVILKKLHNVFNAILRFLIAVAIFAVGYSVYLFDLLRMTVEHDPSDPMMVSLIAAAALVISTAAFRPKNKTAGV